MSIQFILDEEAEQRLIEQGRSITYKQLAQEAHIGYHAVATFFHEKREAKEYAS